MKNSMGISKVASKMEDDYGLRSETFCEGSLIFALGKLSTFFDVPEPTLRIGRKAKNRRAYYRQFGIGEITINSNGWTIATLLHEFSHHLQIIKDKYSDGHGKRFKFFHEAVLAGFIIGKITGLTYERLNVVEELESLYEDYPHTYNSLYEEEISTEDMLKKMQEAIK